MKNKLNEIQETALKLIEDAKESTVLQDIRVKYLGKKGELTTILKSMKDLSKEERPVMGKLVNDVKKVVEEKLDEAVSKIKEEEKKKKLESEVIDITLPGKKNVLQNLSYTFPLLRMLKDTILYALKHHLIHYAFQF